MNSWIIALIDKLRMEAMRISNGGILTKSYGLFIISIGFASISINPAWAYDTSSSVNFNITGKIEEPVCEVSVKPSTRSIWVPYLIKSLPTNRARAVMPRPCPLPLIIVQRVRRQ